MPNRRELLRAWFCSSRCVVLFKSVCGSVQVGVWFCSSRRPEIAIPMRTFKALDT